MKASEMRGFSAQELQDRIAQTRVELHKMQMAHAVSPLEDPSKLRKTRKDLARLLTVLTESQKEEAKK